MGTAEQLVRESVRGWTWLREAPPDHLDGWSLRHLDRLVTLEETASQAVAGRTLLHLDIRADNILLTPSRVWFVDWPHACVGASWFDVVLFAPGVRMQGGPAPNALVESYPHIHGVDPNAITAAVAAMAGYFTHRAIQPSPPGLPTVRRFQAAQGAISRQWLSDRLDWR